MEKYCDSLIYEKKVCNQKVWQGKYGNQKYKIQTGKCRIFLARFSAGVTFFIPLPLGLITR